jgi:hypothetical protein
MGITSGIKRIFWSGPKCSRCGRALKPVGSDYRKEFMEGGKPCTVYQCRRCGKVYCEHCLQPFGMITSGCECGSREMQAYQMWEV